MSTANVIELKKKLVSTAIQLGFLKIQGNDLVLTQAGRSKFLSIPDLLNKIHLGKVKAPRHVQDNPKLTENHLRKVDFRRPK